MPTDAEARRNMSLPTKRPTAWLLSAYHTDSHAAWATWLSNSLSGIQWQLFTLPGRHFRWRIRGNPLSWLDQLPAQAPDLLVATSMVDLACLKGLRPDLAGLPCLYYFHENQFAYPRSARQHPSIDPQMVQLYGALAAERIGFNSAFNRDSFLQGVAKLLQRLPDQLPQGLPERLAEKALILPVPVSPLPSGEKDPRLILWNHRWEYDKAPEVFARAITRLCEQQVDFHLALLGARAGHADPALQQIRSVAGEKILIDGHLARSHYTEWVSRAAIAVSTAEHEFQGLAMLEAVSANAAPLVPDHLCYPEQYPSAFRYPPGDAQALAQRLQDWLNRGPPAAPAVSAYSPSALQPAWQGQLEKLLGARPG